VTQASAQMYLQILLCCEYDDCILRRWNTVANAISLGDPTLSFVGVLAMMPGMSTRLDISQVC